MCVNMRILIIWTKLPRGSDCALIPPFLLYHVFYPLLQSIMLRPPSPPCSSPQLLHRRDLLCGSLSPSDSLLLHPVHLIPEHGISNYAGSSSVRPWPGAYRNSRPTPTPKPLDMRSPFRPTRGIEKLTSILIGSRLPRLSTSILRSAHS